ncbi:MAG: carbon-nitrogen hydrolase [Gammaproteobacteria bacterium]|nr:carbon-nitrogen hydrolase [Gammaproteobacteria bacterium]
MTVALTQHAFSSDRDSNLARSADFIARAANAGARMVLLPELHASLYFCQTEDTDNFDLAEPVPGPTTEFLGQLARRHNVVIVGSVFEKRAAGIYHNTAVVLEADGSLAGIYRKMHIPDDPGFYEKFYFTPGDLGFEPIDTSVGRLGVLVCWDQWYPEAARLMALNGAELLLYPTAIGWNPGDDPAEQQRQSDSWQLVQRGHAIANGLPVLSCNRIGHEKDPSRQSQGIQFWGKSFIAGPQGELLANSEDEEVLLMAEVDMTRSESVRRIWPFFRDRRIEAFSGLLKRFGK